MLAEEAPVEQQPLGHWTCGVCSYSDEGSGGEDPRTCSLNFVPAEEFELTSPACEEFAPIPSECCCDNCANAQTVWVSDLEELPECHVTDDYQLPYETCGDFMGHEDESNRSLKGWDLTDEMPNSERTKDFSLYDIKDFEHDLNVGLFRVYDYLAKGGDGDPNITIKLTDFGERIKSGIVVDLPHKIKLAPGAVKIIRENGKFRTLLSDQPGLFDPREKVPPKWEGCQTPGETTEDQEGEVPTGDAPAGEPGEYELENEQLEFDGEEASEEVPTQENAA